MSNYNDPGLPFNRYEPPSGQKAREIQTWIGEYVLIGSVWTNVRKTIKHLLSSSEHLLQILRFSNGHAGALERHRPVESPEKVQLGSTMGKQRQAQSQGLCSVVSKPQTEVTALQPL